MATDLTGPLRLRRLIIVTRRRRKYRRQMLARSHVGWCR